MDCPSFLEPRLAEVVNMESDRAYRSRLWAVVLGLVPFKDGDAWCVLFGEDIQVGICGWGKCPYAAMIDFEYAMEESEGKSKDGRSKDEGK